MAQKLEKCSGIFNKPRIGGAAHGYKVWGCSINFTVGKYEDNVNRIKEWRNWSDEIVNCSIIHIVNIEQFRCMKSLFSILFKL